MSGTKRTVHAKKKSGTVSKPANTASIVKIDVSPYEYWFVAEDNRFEKKFVTRQLRHGVERGKTFEFPYTSNVDKGKAMEAMKRHIKNRSRRLSSMFISETLRERDRLIKEKKTSPAPAKS